MHVREDEADGVVQLVRNACDQPAQRRHLLGKDKVLLRFLQFAVRRVQALIGAAQLAQRPAHHDAARIAPHMVEARRAAHGKRRRAAACILETKLAIAESVRAQAGHQLPDVLRAVRAEKSGNRLARQLRLAAARDAFERRVDALDAPVRPQTASTSVMDEKTLEISVCASSSAAFLLSSSTWFSTSSA